jgi:hypothetical protein
MFVYLYACNARLPRLKGCQNNGETQMTPAELTEAAHRILSAPRYSLCTWYADVPEQREAAQRALDGDTADLELLLAIDDAELWQRAEWAQDEWLAAWTPTVTWGMAA